jgi:hypothetical protein
MNDTIRQSYLDAEYPVMVLPIREEVEWDGEYNFKAYHPDFGSGTFAGYGDSIDQAVYELEKSRMVYIEDLLDRGDNPPHATCPSCKQWWSIGHECDPKHLKMSQLDRMEYKINKLASPKEDA